MHWSCCYYVDLHNRILDLTHGRRKGLRGLGSGVMLSASPGWSETVAISINGSLLTSHHLYLPYTPQWRRCFPCLLPNIEPWPAFTLRGVIARPSVLILAMFYPFLNFFLSPQASFWDSHLFLCLSLYLPFLSPSSTLPPHWLFPHQIIANRNDCWFMCTGTKINADAEKAKVSLYYLEWCMKCHNWERCATYKARWTKSSKVVQAKCHESSERAYGVGIHGGNVEKAVIGQDGGCLSFLVYKIGTVSTCFMRLLWKWDSMKHYSVFLSSDVVILLILLPGIWS